MATKTQGTVTAAELARTAWTAETLPTIQAKDLPTWTAKDLTFPTMTAEEEAEMKRLSISLADLPTMSLADLPTAKAAAIRRMMKK